MSAKGRHTVAKRSQSWKSLERGAAEALGGKRVVRADFGVSDTDVRIDDFPQLKIDAKYRAAWSHTSYLKEVAKKYAKKPGDIPLLITKQKRQHGAIVCLDLADFGRLLDRIRVLEGRMNVGALALLPVDKRVPSVPPDSSTTGAIWVGAAPMEQLTPAIHKKSEPEVDPHPASRLEK